MFGKEVNSLGEVVVVSVVEENQAITCKAQKSKQKRLHASPLEKFGDLIWCLKSMTMKACHDFPQVHRSKFASEFYIHYMVFCGAADTRGPVLYDIRYKDLRQPEKSTPRTTLNSASYNYSGFLRFEFESRNVVEEAILRLPFSAALPELDTLLQDELCQFLEFQYCFITSIGYAINTLAFPAIANYERLRGVKNPVFLMDRDDHNSMFYGAFISGIEIRKFRHSDAKDLKSKLEQLFVEGYTMDSVWVAIEGSYSTEGAVPPMPAIIELKRQYGFRLYIDEAHSILALGETGRGITEFFQNAGPGGISLDDVDCVSGTFSKSFGGIGGFVLAKDELLAQSLKAREQTVISSGGELLPTIVKIRVLQVLRKKSLILHRLANMRALSVYLTTLLNAAGLYMLNIPGSPVLAYYVGPTSKLCKYVDWGKDVDFAVVGVPPPAARLWEARNRICISGSHTLEDIKDMADKTVGLALRIGFPGVRPKEEIESAWKLVERPVVVVDEAALKKESDIVDIEMLALIDRLSSANLSALLPEELREVALDYSRAFNIGAGGLRWFYGTSNQHLLLEQYLCTYYESLFPQTSPNLLNAITFSDTRTMVLSCIAATLCKACSQRRSHTFFYPALASSEVFEGIKISSDVKAKLVGVSQYSDVHDLTVQLNGSKADHLIVYISTSNILSGELTSALSVTLLGLGKRLNLLIDHTSSTSLRPSSITLLQHLADNLANKTKSPLSQQRCVIFGSFHKAFGLQGGFAVGSSYAVEILSWKASGYMFSAACLPLVMGAARTALESDAHLD